MKINEKAVDFVNKMIEDFGVRSCFDNIDDENPIEEEGVWFECPICGEPILIGEDYDLDEVVEMCPVCECDYYEEG